MHCPHKPLAGSSTPAATIGTPGERGNLHQIAADGSLKGLPRQALLDGTRRNVLDVRGVGRS